MTLPTAFAFETFARTSSNYLERLVDADHLPYFNVFWTDPAEAAHDWPDFGDVMSRQLQGAIMLRRMSGVETVSEKAWLGKTLSLIDPSDGLLHRPETSFSKPAADFGDAALTLYALATAAIDRGDDQLRRTALKMAEGMLAIIRRSDLPAGWTGSFAIKSLMVTARFLHSEAALEAAGLLVDRDIRRGRIFTPDNTFGAWGHMHGNLRSMVGAADYALTAGDPILFSRMDALYQYAKSTGTRFGFLPEATGRQGDIISCETCALMDFAGIGVTLANHGHAEYWGDMERLARNHLAESQVLDVSWLRSTGDRPDTAQFTWREIGPRILGAWAGWSSPNHILAARETLNIHWGGPELHDKTRALQNCCGGSGVHGLFILWKNASRFENGTLSVNLHLDKRLPQAEIRCDQPYRGRLSIRLEQDAAVRIRIPEFVRPTDLQARLNGAPFSNGEHPLAGLAFGNFLELGHFSTGDQVELSYPLPEKTEEVAIGNPGFRQWHYRVTWKGDTVVRIEPLGNEDKTAYSDFDKAAAEVFYGEEGPGPLYQREHMRQDLQPRKAELHCDEGALDFWKII